MAKDIENEVMDEEKPKKAKKDDINELVDIEIPITQELQDDWFCCVNGRTFQVQRGEKVQVPRWVKEVYDNEQRMEKESIRRSQALQKKLADKEKAFS
jgi:hypothetical protein